METAAFKSTSESVPSKKQQKVPIHSVPISPWFNPPVSMFVGRVIQRKANCACGGDCPRCQEESDHPHIQTKLSISTPGDQYELEADRVSEQMMRMPDPQSSRERNAPPESLSSFIQRKCTSCAPSHDSPETSDTTGLSPSSGGSPLPESTRAFFEPRFGYDFSQVRIHTDTSAAESARAVSARAYTAGRDIVFASGEFAPESQEGKSLLAHELVHFIQQGQPGPARGVLMRRWDNATQCATEPQNKWITRIVVDQATPQSITVHWSDGTTESDQCSTGKGHCCVPAGSAEGGTCSEAGSRVNGSNCTPVTAGMPVVNRVLDHNGVAFWTEIDSVRAIALHEYAPVDGTPLSHGCIRLNRPMAIKIFCGSRRSRRQQTIVEIINLARPMCETTSLQQEWLGDFRQGGLDLSQFDGDRDTQASIRETRRELNAAFGRTLTIDQIHSLTVADIPRCRIATAEEARATAPGTRSSPTVPAQILSASGFAGYSRRFTRALAGATDLISARSIVAQHAGDLWQAATARTQSSTPDTDDRPLYWARLQMMQALRFWQPTFFMPFSQRATLMTLFEQTARGMPSATFTAAPGTKRILISGFDPFQLTGAGVVRGNPSGAAVLSLDGRQLTGGNVAAQIQAVIFPVRFADFDAGIVESFFSPYLAGPNPVDMIMTISQGGSSDVEAEQFAGRRRGTSTPDNLSATGGPSSSQVVVPPGMVAGSEFLETTLPVNQIRSAVGRTTPTVGETELTEIPAGQTAESYVPSGGRTPGSTAVGGSGGNYLSNEIFYRTSLLRVQSQLANPGRRIVPVGHLHTPFLSPSATGISDPQFVAARDAIVTQVEQILRATLPTL